VEALFNCCIAKWLPAGGMIREKTMQPFNNEAMQQLSHLAG
jgi:hypothetical protein